MRKYKTIITMNSPKRELTNSSHFCVGSRYRMHKFKTKMTLFNMKIDILISKNAEHYFKLFLFLSILNNKKLNAVYI